MPYITLLFPNGSRVRTFITPATSTAQPAECRNVLTLHAASAPAQHMPRFSPASVPSLSLWYCFPFNQASVISIKEVTPNHQSDDKPWEQPMLQNWETFPTGWSCCIPNRPGENVFSLFCLCAEKLKHISLIQSHSDASGNC